MKSKGLGDTVAKITHAMGIEPCGGCKERQQALNNLFPYKGDNVILAKEIPQPSGPQFIAYGLDGIGVGVINGKLSQNLSLIIGSAQGDAELARMVKPMERIPLVSPEPAPAANAPAFTEQHKLDASEAAKLRETIDAAIATFVKNTGRSA